MIIEQILAAFHHTVSTQTLGLVRLRERRRAHHEGTYAIELQLDGDGGATKCLRAASGVHLVRLEQPAEKGGSVTLDM